MKIMKLNHYLKIENWKLRIHRKRMFLVFTSNLAIDLIIVVVFKFTAPSAQVAWFDDAWAYRNI